jgi:hypothetical protein
VNLNDNKLDKLKAIIDVDYKTAVETDDLNKNSSEGSEKLE